MKVVDILRDHGRRFADAIEAGEREVSTARPRGGKMRIHGEAPPPRFVMHVLAREVRHKELAIEGAPTGHGTVVRSLGDADFNTGSGLQSVESPAPCGGRDTTAAPRCSRRWRC